MAKMETYSLDNEVFRVFVTYAVLVVFKMFALALATSYVRITKTVFVNREDINYSHPDLPEEKFQQMLKQPSAGKETVERIRRCHLNDLENIPAFLIVGLLYLSINPVASTAIWHFRVFTASRFIHNVVYLLALPQPSRGISYTVGLVTTVSMGVQILLAAAQF